MLEYNKICVDVFFKKKSIPYYLLATLLYFITNTYLPYKYFAVRVIFYKKYCSHHLRTFITKKMLFFPWVITSPTSKPRADAGGESQGGEEESGDGRRRHWRVVEGLINRGHA